METLEKRIEAIEQRNRRVESDKAWETSLLRRALVMAFTYVIVFAYSIAIDSPSPALNALVPTAGFLLSTLTIPAIKQRWVVLWNTRKSLG